MHRCRHKKITLPTISSMKHLLGVDPGGTKCAALLVAPDGTALKWHSFMKKRLTGRHLSAILSASKEVLAGHSGEMLCAAMGTRSFFKPEARQAFGPDIEFLPVPVHEYESATALADEKHGIIQVAGTGASLHLLAEDGQRVTMDGAGPLVGDFGSGFWIGLNALRAMARGRMHRRHATSLCEAIPSIFSRHELGRIRVLKIDANDRMTVAALAEVVDAEAEGGDRVSREILHRAADELAETLFELLDNENMLEAKLPYIGIGSVVCKSSIVWHQLVENIRTFAPNLRFVRLSQWPAVVGVALAGAQKVLSETDYRAYRLRLLASFSKLHVGDANDTSKIS